MALITYTQAVEHLKQTGVLDGSPTDDDLTLKIEQASALVVSHLKRPGEWDLDSVPADDPEFCAVQAATLKVLGNLYRFRGDDAMAPSPISPDVEAMLHLYQWKVIA